MPVPSPASPVTRARLVPYVAATALGSTAYIAASTTASLAARDITGSAQLAGLPNALGTVATATAIGLLSAVMARRGRRSGLLAGFLAALGGALTSLTAIALGSLVLLVAGSIAIGFGNAALQLARYSASDIVPPERRAWAVGTVVWGSTAGAVLGPNLLQPAGSLADVLGRPMLQGAMAAAVLGFGLTLVVTYLLIRPARVREAREPASGEDVTAPFAVAAGPVSRDGLLAALAPLRVRIALVGLVTGQVVMVLIMTMTPVHIHDMGEPLSTVGFVLSAHTLGMFALSPLSGRLVERFGPLPVLAAGFATLLVAAVLAAIAHETDIPVLAVALFLLGYGWNVGFVSGSSLLTTGASLAERIRLQGVTDVAVWTAGATASFSSGILLQVAGYPVLATVGGMLLAVPALVVGMAWRRMPRLVPVEEAG